LQLFQLLDDELEHLVLAGLRAQDSGFGVQGSEFEVERVGFNVQVSGFRV
jgi:hypothetical protein